MSCPKTKNALRGQISMDFILKVNYQILAKMGE